MFQNYAPSQRNKSVQIDSDHKLHKALRFDERNCFACLFEILLQYFIEITLLGKCSSPMGKLRLYLLNQSFIKMPSSFTGTELRICSINRGGGTIM